MVIVPVKITLTVRFPQDEWHGTEGMLLVRSRIRDTDVHARHRLNTTSKVTVRINTPLKMYWLGLWKSSVTNGSRLHVMALVHYRGTEMCSDTRSISFNTSVSMDLYVLIRRQKVTDPRQKKRMSILHISA